MTNASVESIFHEFLKIEGLYKYLRNLSRNHKHKSRFQAIITNKLGDLFENYPGTYGEFTSSSFPVKFFIPSDDGIWEWEESKPLYLCSKTFNSDNKVVSSTLKSYSKYWALTEIPQVCAQLDALSYSRIRLDSLRSVFTEEADELREKIVTEYIEVFFKLGLFFHGEVYTASIQTDSHLSPLTWLSEQNDRVHYRTDSYMISDLARNEVRKI